MKEERLAILRMLEKGNISVDEAERLLNAVNNTNDKDISETINNALGKAGSLLEKFGKKAGEVAKTVSQKAEEKYPEVKKTAKNVVNRLLMRIFLKERQQRKQKIRKKQTRQSLRILLMM